MTNERTYTVCKGPELDCGGPPQVFVIKASYWIFPTLDHVLRKHGRLGSWAHTDCINIVRRLSERMVVRKRNGW
jgi:hypothetical protein